MRNTRRTNSRKPHAKKHDRALTKRKHIAKRTMKGGAVGENTTQSGSTQMPGTRIGFMSKTKKIFGGLKRFPQMLSNKFNYIAKFKANFTNMGCDSSYFILNNNETLANKVNMEIGNKSLVTKFEDVYGKETKYKDNSSAAIRACNTIYMQSLYDNTKLGYILASEKSQGQYTLQYKKDGTTKQDIINANIVIPPTLRIFMYKTKSIDNSPTTLPPSMTPSQVSNQASIFDTTKLTQDYKNNTICKDTENDAWALKYFIVNPDEELTDTLIEQKIGNDSIGGEPANSKLSQNYSYYKQLLDSGLVNVIKATIQSRQVENEVIVGKKYKYIPGSNAATKSEGPKLYVYYTPIIYMNGDKPAIGNKHFKLVPRDDAKGVKVIRVRDIANGKYGMPFLHVWFALDYYKNYCGGSQPELVKQLEVVYQLSRIRNHRIMRKINAKVAGMARPDGNGQVQPFAYDFADTPNVGAVQTLADSLGVTTNLYLDESNDDKEVEGCSNAWNLNQQPPNPEKQMQAGEGAASDNIPILTDLNGDDWFLLIIRGNAPGINNYAWAGGFVDNKETFAEAAERELDEEIEGGANIAKNDPMTNVIVKTARTTLETTKQLDWDPRIKFYNGMTVGATVYHNYFFDKNNAANINKPIKYKCAKPIKGNNAK